MGVSAALAAARRVGARVTEHVGSTEGAAVRLRLGQRRWTLACGEVLTFGRSRDCDIRLGHDPEDDYVSRQAGEIAVLPDGLLIRNCSRTQPLVLRPLPGAEVHIASETGVVRSKSEFVQLVVPGRHGSAYTLVIDSRLPERAPMAVPDPARLSAGALPTRAGASRISPRERRMLAALCEPRLLLAGEGARPATYSEIAERLGTTPSSVKVCLDAVRRRLSDEDGIPGLRNDEDGGSRDTANFLLPLAGWAVATGAVTLKTLGLLDRPDVGTT